MNKPYMIIAIYDNGYDFDVLFTDRKITKTTKRTIKNKYDIYPYNYEDDSFEKYLKRYYGKRYQIIIVENGYIERLKYGKEN